MMLRWRPPGSPSESGPKWSFPLTVIEKTPVSLIAGRWALAHQPAKTRRLQAVDKQGSGGKAGHRPMGKRVATSIGCEPFPEACGPPPSLPMTGSPAPAAPTARFPKGGSPAASWREKTQHFGLGRGLSTASARLPQSPGFRSNTHRFLAEANLPVADIRSLDDRLFTGSKNLGLPIPGKAVCHRIRSVT